MKFKRHWRYEQVFEDISAESITFPRVEESGNSNLHIVFFDKSLVQKVRDELKQLGCDSELSDIPQLIAVNIPRVINYFEKIRPLRCICNAAASKKSKRPVYNWATVQMVKIHGAKNDKAMTAIGELVY